MSDQRCGTCRWFVELRKATRNIEAGGKCTWLPSVRSCEPLPVWIFSIEPYVSAIDGKDCPTWHTR